MLRLPDASFLVTNQDPPHRHHIVAERDFKHRDALIRVCVASNWSRNKWFVSAFYVEAHLRASQSLATSSKKVATEWVRGVVSGQVMLEVMNGYVTLLPVSSVRSDV
jgi:hypothetical protein